MSKKTKTVELTERECQIIEIVCNEEMERWEPAEGATPQGRENCINQIRDLEEIVKKVK